MKHFFHYVCIGQANVRAFLWERSGYSRLGVKSWFGVDTDSLKCRSHPVLASLYFEHIFPVTLRRTHDLTQPLLTFRLAFFKPNVIFTSSFFLSFLLMLILNLLLWQIVFFNGIVCYLHIRKYHQTIYGYQQMSEEKWGLGFLLQPHHTHARTHTHRLMRRTWSMWRHLHI